MRPTTESRSAREVANPPGPQGKHPPGLVACAGARRPSAVEPEPSNCGRGLFLECGPHAPKHYHLISSEPGDLSLGPMRFGGTPPLPAFDVNGWLATSAFASISGARSTPRRMPRALALSSEPTRSTGRSTPVDSCPHGASGRGYSAGDEGRRRRGERDGDPRPTRVTPGGRVVAASPSCVGSS